MKLKKQFENIMRQKLILCEIKTLETSYFFNPCSKMGEICSSLGSFEKLYLLTTTRDGRLSDVVSFFFFADSEHFCVNAKTLYTMLGPLYY